MTYQGYRKLTEKVAGKQCIPYIREEGHTLDRKSGSLVIKYKVRITPHKMYVSMKHKNVFCVLDSGKITNDGKFKLIFNSYTSCDLP